MFYLKTFGALVIGLYLGMKINMDLVNANMNFFPPPEGFDWTDADTTAAYLSSLPASAYSSSKEHRHSLLVHWDSQAEHFEQRTTC